MKFWPFPLIRICPTNSELSRLFFMFAEQGDLTVALGTHRSTVCCSLGTLMFWTENRYYGWAMEGEFTNAAGVSATWEKEMPSRAAVRAMARAMRPYQHPRFVIPA